MLFLLCNIKYNFYIIFCGDVLVVYLVTLVVYMFVDIVYDLVHTGNYVIIAIINTPVAVVPYMTRAAVI